MRPFLILKLFLLLLLPLPAEESYPRHPDSLPQEGVPQGKLTKHQLDLSTTFPGTERDYWLYVPAQYDGEKPACLMVFQDGSSYVNNPKSPGYLPTIFDNLIHAGDMPVTIGLFINPGVVPAPHDQAQPRFNRSFEYDSMGPRYATFLIDEMLPKLTKEHALKISENPDDRAISGASSGAIAAFTVAWERPDQFRRVYSMIGTYVGLRNGHDYPTLIRETEPKPLRIFLQGGTKDLNIYCGDWWMANQTMQRALAFAGYEHTHVWGEGGHNRQHGNALMPDALRWLWQDHGKTPVTTHLDQAQSRAAEWLIPGEDWEVVSEGHNWAEGLALSADGTLYFTDVPDSEIYRLSPDGELSLFAKESGNANGIALGPDGKTLYTASGGAKEIRAYDLATGKHEVVLAGHRSNDLVISHSGQLYFTDPAAGKIHHIHLPTRRHTIVDEDFKGPNGIGLSADQSLLFVCHFDGPFIHSYQIQPDGKLRHKQAYFHAHRPTDDRSCTLDGQCVASNGHLLVGTATGVQIFDQPGRVNLVLPKPRIEDGRINYCALHGSTLYIATKERIYKRKTKLHAAPAWQPPVNPGKPKL